MRSIWIGALALAVIWLVAGAVIFFARAAQPTPEKIQAFIAANPLDGQDATARGKVIERTALQLNRLTFEQRRELHKTRAVPQFFEHLTDGERSHFLDLTLPEGFLQVMTALNKMTAEKRQRLVQRVLDDIRQNDPQAAERLNGPEVQKVMAHGFSSFYRDADANVKLEFAPVIEELQRATQSMR